MSTSTLNVRAKQPISGSSSTTHTFNGAMYGYVLINDGGSDINITVNGYTFTVKSMEVFDEFLDPFKSVVIDNPSSSPFRAYGRG